MEQITFTMKDKQHIHIMRNNEVIGQIFSPSGSGNETKNAIQICGFSEAFDFWGCGVFKGFKDIQLLFDGTKLKGEYNPTASHWNIQKDCIKCYHTPCQCEQPEGGANPFIVKRGTELKKRLNN